MSFADQANVSTMPPGVTDPNYRPLPGRLGNLTAAQQHALDTLRGELQAEGHFVPERMDDATLLRWVLRPTLEIACNRPVQRIVCDGSLMRTWSLMTSWLTGSCGHANSTLQKQRPCCYLLNSGEKNFGIDDLMVNFEFTEKEDVDKYYPQYYHKTDKDGRPIYIERLGKLDITALYNLTTQERQLKRFVMEYERFLSERLPASSKAIGHPVETSCTILDLQGVSITNFYRVKDYVFQTAKIGQDRYPECMGKFYIINAPWAFSTVWMIIKPWLDEVTVSKIDILGSNYKDKLLAQIPAENLPADLGGKCRCRSGCSLSDAGPWNPQQNGEV
ncbi:CRAL-TRIO domain-containing protein [Pisolithus croceorrhizus]|nr:CRAL-TRIO domain-containing protein [Pisolithus croceorrhizus]